VRDESRAVHGNAQHPLLPDDEDAPSRGLPRPHDDPAARTPRVAIAPAPRAPRPASFARRGIALFLDLMLLSLLDAVLMMLATTAVLLAERVTGARIGGAVQLIRSAVSAGSLTLLVGYFSVLHARSGQTLGKAAMQIEVRSANGGRVGILPSVLRTFSYALSLLPFGAGFLLALLPPQRALHDHIAGTRVVRVEDHE
jgi:uncharacterized RDD family membrane protein YckC